MKIHVDEPAQFSFQGMSNVSMSPDLVRSVAELTGEDVERIKKVRPKKLGIVCGRSECEQNLHCFRPPKRARDSFGSCQSCGIDLVNWNEMYIRDLTDAPHKFELLKKEWIRHFFFHLSITPRIRSYADKLGTTGLENLAHKQLAMGKMLQFNREWDWNQTKMLDGNIVHWARHAVACCCRRCMAYWHNVSLDATLSDVDIDYFVQLIMLYIDERMSDLSKVKPSSHRAEPVGGTELMVS
jgi:hypothetical protein